MSDTKLAQDSTAKGVWVTPSLSYDGDLRDLVLGGGGKVSASAGDPGEGKKPTGGTA